MGRLLDYDKKMREVKTPFTGGEMPYIRTRTVLNPLAGQQPTPFVSTPQQPAEQPQIDTSDAIGSLATLLGPTPAEREARERRLQENKSKMQAWTGLFDGLRQLGNLYYASKGATPQQFSSPYQQVEQQYQQQHQLQDANDQYARQYATSLYNLRRQVRDDARRDILAKAQADYYGTRDEKAKADAELQKYKAVKYFKNDDGSWTKYDPVTGTLEKIQEADPLKVDYLKARTKTTQQQGDAAETRARNSGKGRSSGGSKKKGKSTKGANAEQEKNR